MLLPSYSRRFQKETYVRFKYKSKIEVNENHLSIKAVTREFSLWKIQVCEILMGKY